MIVTKLYKIGKIESRNILPNLGGKTSRKREKNPEKKRGGDVAAVKGKRCVGGGEQNMAVVCGFALPGRKRRVWRGENRG